MHKKSMLKAAVAVIVVLALVLPGSAAFANFGIGVQTVNEVDDNNIKETPEVLDTIDWWPMKGHDLRHTGYSTSIAPDTANLLWSFSCSGLELTSPAVVDDMVYFGNGGVVQCLDAGTGSVIWGFSTGHIQSSPAVVDGRVFVGSGNKNVYCLNAQDGSLLWNFTTGGMIWSSPAVADGKVFIGSWDGDVYCLDASDGSLIWSCHRSFGSYCWSSPAVVDGRVFVGSGIDVYCLNASDGSLVWNYPTGGTVASSPAVVDGRVFVGSRDCNVYCLNAQNGSLLWNYPTGDTVQSSPAVAYGKVFIGSHDGMVYCLNVLNGSVIWNYSTDRIVSSSPAVADGKVYIGSDGENLYCLDMMNGALIWHYSGVDQIRSSLAVADGKVFAIGYFGVYCFGPQPPDVTPPVTTHDFDGTIGENNWYVSDVTVTFTATDDLSGVNYTMYSVDRGEWYRYDGPFAVSDSGEHIVWFYSVDYAGNVEDTNEADFKIDQTDPTIELDVEKTGFRKWRFTADVSDATSGIAKVEFYVDGELVGEVTSGPWEYEYSGTGEKAKAIVYDNAGNSAESAEVDSNSNQHIVFNLLERFLQRFPILERILSIINLNRR